MAFGLGIVRSTFTGFPRNTSPLITNYENGTYIGHYENGLPHGAGLYALKGDDKKESIMFFGGFARGVEHGVGVVFHPRDASSFHGVYSQGKLVKDSSISDAEVIKNLKNHMYNMCLFLDDLVDDLNMEKETVEQVNSALYSSREQFDALFRLAASTPGVDVDALYAIKNRT